MNKLAQRAMKVHERLIEFYGEPTWRNPLPAIDELVSTILSQNTNDINRDRAFNALRAAAAASPSTPNTLITPSPAMLVTWPAFCRTADVTAWM